MCSLSSVESFEDGGGGGGGVPPTEVEEDKRCAVSYLSLIEQMSASVVASATGKGVSMYVQGVTVVASATDNALSTYVRDEEISEAKKAGNLLPTRD